MSEIEGKVAQGSRGGGGSRPSFKHGFLNGVIPSRADGEGPHTRSKVRKRELGVVESERFLQGL